MATNINAPKYVYICGPWYGENTQERFEEYLRLGSILVDLGFTPIFPAFFGTDPLPQFEVYEKDTLGKLLLSQYIYLMRGWQKSYAAAFEYIVALNAGIQILCDEGEFPGELDPCFPPERRYVRTWNGEPFKELTTSFLITDHYAEDNETFMDYYFRHVLLPAERGIDTAAAE